MGVWIMAGITFREAARKKILWTALLAGAAFSRWTTQAPHTKGPMKPTMKSIA